MTGPGQGRPGGKGPGHPSSHLALTPCGLGQHSKCLARPPGPACGQCKRSIPSKVWIQEMYTQINQAVLDGMQSVEDPQYLGSYLPLWSIGFWKEILDLVEV